MKIVFIIFITYFPLINKCSEIYIFTNYWTFSSFIFILFFSRTVFLTECLTDERTMRDSWRLAEDLWGHRKQNKTKLKQIYDNTQTNCCWPLLQLRLLLRTIHWVWYILRLEYTSTSALSWKIFLCHSPETELNWVSFDFCFSKEEKKCS